jgi:glycosyltransferase involved in cell wall biosynthesis
MTGSAVMTVIDGLARPTAESARHQVLVAEGTYAERYNSADVISYPPAPPRSRSVRLVDTALARMGAGRPFASREYRAAFKVLSDAPHTVLLHNAPNVATLLPAQSAPVLYAHNEILHGAPWAAHSSVRGLEGIITVSEWLAERTRHRVPRSMRSRVVSLVNGVDTDSFVPVDRTDRDGLRILYVGRVVPEKGPDVLLDAVERAGIHGLTVRIVGSEGFAIDGPLSSYERALRRRASTLSCGVEFVPFTPRAKLPAHYDWADVVTLPSRWEEPCGLTLLESLASGVATVVTESGGMPEVAGDAAIVIRRNDPGALIDVLRQLADAPTARSDLGRRARERSMEFTWAGRAERLHEILEEWGLPTAGPGREVAANG